MKKKKPSLYLGQIAHPVQIISTTPQAQAQLQQIVAAQTGGTTPKREQSSGSGHHPVKKRSSQQMTKCQKCNGSGVVLVGQNPSAGHSGSGGSVKQSVTVKTE